LEKLSGSEALESGAQDPEVQEISPGESALTKVGAWTGGRFGSRSLAYKMSCRVGKNTLTSSIVSFN
jgi:hypothetical protein